MYQAKSGVKNFSLYWGGSPWKSCLEWAETNFGFGIFEIQWFFLGGVPLWDTNIHAPNQTDTCRSDQISRSACRDSMTKNKDVTGPTKSVLQIVRWIFQIDLWCNNC